MTTFTMTDAATFNPAMLTAQAVAGYFGGPNAFRAWTDNEWQATGDKPKLPIWVPGPTATATDARNNEIYQIVNKLIHYNIPRGQAIAFDLETSQADAAYMREMIACLHYLGMGIIAYGSRSTIQASAGGAWIWDADWTGVPHISPGSAGTQWTSDTLSGEPYDTSEINEGFFGFLKWR